MTKTLKLLDISYERFSLILTKTEPDFARKTVGRKKGRDMTAQNGLKAVFETSKLVGYYCTTLLRVPVPRHSNALYSVPLLS